MCRPLGGAEGLWRASGTEPARNGAPRGRPLAGGIGESGAGLDRGGALTGLADGALLTQLGPATDLTRLLVVLALAQLLLQPAPLQELLEAAQRRGDRFPVMHTHP